MGRVDRTMGWKKLYGNVFKGYLDATSCTNSKKVGVGIVIRDCEGELVAALCRTEEHLVPPKIA